MRIGYDPEVKYRHLEVDARARIAWGHDKKRVEAFLRAHEMPSGRIHKIVDDATSERDQAFRLRGIWDLALAAVISLIALFAAVPIALHHGIHAGIEALGPFDYVVLAVAGWLTAQGSTRLLLGGAGEGSTGARDAVNDEVVWRLQYGAMVVIMVVIGTALANLLR